MENVNRVRNVVCDSRRKTQFWQIYNIILYAIRSEWLFFLSPSQQSLENTTPAAGVEKGNHIARKSTESLNTSFASYIYPSSVPRENTIRWRRPKFPEQQYARTYLYNIYILYYIFSHCIYCIMKSKFLVIRYTAEAHILRVSIEQSGAFTVFIFYFFFIFPIWRFYFYYYSRFGRVFFFHRNAVVARRRTAPPMIGNCSHGLFSSADSISSFTRLHNIIIYNIISLHVYRYAHRATVSNTVRRVCVISSASSGIIIIIIIIQIYELLETGT